MKSKAKRPIVSVALFAFAAVAGCSSEVSRVAKDTTDPRGDAASDAQQELTDVNAPLDVLPHADALLDVAARPDAQEDVGTDSDADTPKCGLMSSIPACDKCLQERCCDEALACAVSAVCVAMLECLDECDTRVCAEQCTAKYTEGARILANEIVCLNKNCPDC